MKLYIIDDGLWHLCEPRKRIDSLFYKRKDYFLCPICKIKIPDWVAFPFINSIPKDQYSYSTLSKNGRVIDYDITQLSKLKYTEIEFDETISS